LEEELIHSQQSLIQSRNELMTMAEHITFQSQEHNAITDILEAKLIQDHQALTQSIDEMGTIEDIKQLSLGNKMLLLVG
jgi:hypothetical protein